MDLVKKLVGAGATITGAIREALAKNGLSVTEFADRYEIPRPAMSDAINGTRKPSDTIVAALITELGGTDFEWRMLLWEAGKPESARSA